MRFVCWNPPRKMEQATRLCNPPFVGIVCSVNKMHLPQSRYAIKNHITRKSVKGVRTMVARATKGCSDLLQQLPKTGEPMDYWKGSNYHIVVCNNMRFMGSDPLIKSSLTRQYLKGHAKVFQKYFCTIITVPWGPTGGVRSEIF